MEKPPFWSWNYLMRIIGGTAAGRLLKVPKGLAVRPTPDLVKQAIFNSLGSRVAGSRVLELFAGSGALGLECLSRGAVSLVSVEKSARHASFIRANLIDVGISPGTLEMRVQDAFAAVRQLAASARAFDLILADPPYGEKNRERRSESFAQQLLDLQDLTHLLARDGCFVLGHAKRDTLVLPDLWRERRTLRHGDSIIRILELPRSIPITSGADGESQDNGPEPGTSPTREGRSDPNASEPARVPKGAGSGL